MRRIVFSLVVLLFAVASFAQEVRNFRLEFESSTNAFPRNGRMVASFIGFEGRVLGSENIVPRRSDLQDERKFSAQVTLARSINWGSVVMIQLRAYTPDGSELSPEWRADRLRVMNGEVVLAEPMIRHTFSDRMPVWTSQVLASTAEAWLRTIATRWELLLFARDSMRKDGNGGVLMVWRDGSVTRLGISPSQTINNTVFNLNVEGRRFPDLAKAFLFFNDANPLVAGPNSNLPLTGVEGIAPSQDDWDIADATIRIQIPGETLRQGRVMTEFQKKFSGQQFAQFKQLDSIDLNSPIPADAFTARLYVLVDHSNWETRSGDGQTFLKAALRFPGRSSPVVITPPSPTAPFGLGTRDHWRSESALDKGNRLKWLELGFSWPSRGGVLPKSLELSIHSSELNTLYQGRSKIKVFGAFLGFSRSATAGRVGPVGDKLSGLTLLLAHLTERGEELRSGRNTVTIPINVSQPGR